MTLPDVAVIGGGIIGTATAAYLAAAGATVRLYEQAGIAAGASGRNSGVVQHPLDPELAALHAESLVRYRELEAETDGSFALPDAPAGLLFLAEDTAAVEAAARTWRRRHPHLRAEVLDATEVARLEPALAPGLAACRVDIGYPVAPAVATQAFASLAEARGATIQTVTRATLEVVGGRATGVRTGAGVEKAGVVIVAAGPWSPEIVDPLGRWRPIVPWWGVVVGVQLEHAPGHVLEQLGIATEPGDGGAPPGHGPAEGRHGPAGAGHDPDVEFSLVTARRASSVGSTFLDGEPDAAEWETRILRAGARFVPGIATARVVGHRACARPLALDGRPLVGQIPGIANSYIAAGHGPWGISTGPASAREIADLVLGRVDAPPISKAFDPARFGAPGNAGRGPRILHA
ncbi:MAG: FAD-dependent oxidoreductase [Candidatus Limnocylindrales bacterium]